MPKKFGLLIGYVILSESGCQLTRFLKIDLIGANCTLFGHNLTGKDLNGPKKIKIDRIGPKRTKDGLHFYQSSTKVGFALDQNQPKRIKRNQNEPKLFKLDRKITKI